MPNNGSVPQSSFLDSRLRASNISASRRAPSPATTMAQAASFMTEVERLAHYRELAAQFRKWAETETNEEARAGLLDMARQYERLASGSRSRPERGLAEPPS
jgi:hypothetical protein